MAHYKPGNDNGKSTRFKPGQSGNARGRPRGGATVREWWNRLLDEDDQGRPKFTVQALWNIAEAENDDPDVSPTKRIAARSILDMIKGGRTGREALAQLFDRTEGRPSQSVNINATLGADPAAEITAATLDRIRAATSGAGE